MLQSFALRCFRGVGGFSLLFLRQRVARLAKVVDFLSKIRQPCSLTAVCLCDPLGWYFTVICLNSSVKVCHQKFHNPIELVFTSVCDHDLWFVYCCKSASRVCVSNRIWAINIFIWLFFKLFLQRWGFCLFYLLFRLFIIGPLGVARGVWTTRYLAKCQIDARPSREDPVAFKLNSARELANWFGLEFFFCFPTINVYTRALVLSVCVCIIRYFCSLIWVIPPDFILFRVVSFGDNSNKRKLWKLG